jgi:very-short-patch-repair endonuclease
MSETEWSLGERARELRNAPTPFETILWFRLSRSQLGGHKFRRQAVIDRFICDFFCPAKGLIVEVDGDTHDAVRDAARDARLLRRGFATIRFTNADVGHNLDGVLEVILARLEEMPDRWAGAHPQPHPDPSPEGEGLVR